MATIVIAIAQLSLMLVYGPWAFSDFLIDLAKRNEVVNFMPRFLLFMALLGGAIWGGVTKKSSRPIRGMHLQGVLQKLMGGALMGAGNELVQRTSRSSLKILGTVGEPINPEVWKWYYMIIGKEKCPIIDTWWQTETGGILISPLAGLTKLKPCYATLPLPGIQPCLVDTDGKLVEGNGVEGNGVEGW